MIAGWGTRTVRAAMFAAVCVLLAALGHVTMSGSPVPWWAMGAAAAATGGVGWCLAGRERGLPLIVSVVLAAQTALHSGFSLTQPSHPAGADGPVTGGSANGGSVGGSVDWGSVDGGFGGPSAMDMGSAHMQHSVHTGSAGHMGHADHTGYLMDGPFTASSGMLAAHLLAALLCGLWLAYGERAAFGLLRAVAGWLAAPLRMALSLAVPPGRPRPRVRRGRSDRSPRRLLLVHTLTSRGPPAGIAVS
ncbi:hypothetical protein [Streptomyces neyagawaensis]|uniref:hypothetical protein n=2 Tax=Streptomyces neyagawaensis TaxID=42238 RepID=UPI00201D24E6|nr:hypothetical protein [Streptomyces neyagawaensis]MCL6736262.1 hypothetical protein [Streptomyces neyagawaensis]MDE1684223.1 hypothetical protein [Streptomyces neyagawaensis]